MFKNLTNRKIAIAGLKIAILSFVIASILSFISLIPNKLWDDTKLFYSFIDQTEIVTSKISGIELMYNKGLVNNPVNTKLTFTAQKNIPQNWDKGSFLNLCFGQTAKVLDVSIPGSIRKIEDFVEKEENNCVIFNKFFLNNGKSCEY